MGRLILFPAAISLAVTILRVTGELRHWPGPWFSAESGIVGITWLAPVFGIYFAVKLARAGRGPQSKLKAFGYALLGVAIMLCGNLGAEFLYPAHVGFRGFLLCLWISLAVAGVVTLPAWPELWKTLLAYGYSARLPVVVIMFFAFRGRWGTHYGWVARQFADATLLSKWLWLGFFPQLVFWIGFTLVAGVLSGAIAAALVRAHQHPPAREG